MGKLSHLKKAVTDAKRRVYQGSPHKYDGKLDHSKIGTGEGAQAYGYGHYLAESEGVARSYRDGLAAQHNLGIPSTRAINAMPTAAEMDAVKLANRAMRNNLPARLREKGGKFTPNFHNYHSYYNFRNDIKYYDDLYMKQHGDDVLAEIEKIKQIKKDNPDAFEYLYGEDFNVDALKTPYRAAYEKAGEAINQIGGGHLYEFDLPESAIDNMLDWDAPLSEQPESVRKILEGIGFDPKDTRTGQDMYFGLSAHMGREHGDTMGKVIVSNPQKTSEYLQQLGIPGIKYHDGMSRAAGEGTRNFVIFPGNEDMVKAVSRNGEKLSAAALAPLAGIGLMGTFSEDSQAGVGGTIKAAGKALDMSDIARAQRARDMGFDVDTVWYHGSADDIDRFSLSHPNRKDAGWLGDGVYLWKDPEPAGSYANIKAGADAPNVMPLYAKKGNYYKATLADKQKLQAIEHSRGREAARIEARNLTERLRNAGYDGVMLEYDPKDVGRSASTELVVFDPESIRSVNAAFDPAKKDSADLLASLGGAGVLGAAALSPEDARAAELEAIALYGEPERGWRPTEKRNKWKQFKQQYVEPLGTIASSLASLPVSGLEGLGALAQGYGIDDAVGAMERRQAAMTYVPGSESGRQSLANIGEAMEILGEAPPVSMATDALNHGADVAYRYGSKVHPKVGAALGATVKTLPEVIF